MTATTRNEAAERLRDYIKRHGMDGELSREYASASLDKALVAAKAEGAREAVERIRAAIDAAVDPDNWGPADFVESTVHPILDEEAAR